MARLSPFLVYTDVCNIVDNFREYFQATSQVFLAVCACVTSVQIRGGDLGGDRGDRPPEIIRWRGRRRFYRYCWSFLIQFQSKFLLSFTLVILELLLTIVFGSVFRIISVILIGFL